MDLILCPKCRRALLADFYACPHGGHDFQSRAQKIMKILFGVLLALAGVAMTFSSILHR